MNVMSATIKQDAEALAQIEQRLRMLAEKMDAVPALWSRKAFRLLHGLSDDDVYERSFLHRERIMTSVEDLLSDAFLISREDGLCTEVFELIYKNNREWRASEEINFIAYSEVDLIKLLVRLVGRIKAMAEHAFMRVGY